MLNHWAKSGVRQLYRNWAGNDPHARPSGKLFQTLSHSWRSSRALYRRWKFQQTPILLALDGEPRLTGCGSISGWAYSSTASSVSIEGWVDNQLIAQTTCDISRPDVFQTFPHFHQQQLPGFRLCPDPKQFKDGEYMLEIRAIDSLGHQAEYFSRLIVDRFTLQDDHGLSSDFAGTQREYQHWLREHDVHLLQMPSEQPLISIVIPVFRPRLDHLHQAIDSVLKQTYPHWELCISDDGSDNPCLTDELTELTHQHPNIKLLNSEYNRGISQATNAAIGIANGEYVALLDQDDALHPQALQALACAAQNSPGDVYYTDEDRIDACGRRSEPFFKPGWSSWLLRGMMYFGHLCMYRRAFVNQEWCRSEFDGSQDWELALRITDKPGCRVVHVPGIYYHWRLGGVSSRADVNQQCHKSGRQIVEESIRRKNQACQIVDGPRACTFHVNQITEQPLVSILIPTRNNVELLYKCLNSIRSQTQYPRYEIIAIDNGSSESDTLDYLEQCPADRVIRMDIPFNHSKLNNEAARHARGEYLLLLNDDVEVLSTDWLDVLVSQATQPEVGACGAWLIYPDGRTQHAGIVLEAHAVARNLSDAIMLDGLDRGISRLSREVSAVSGACMIIKKSLYLEQGGLDADNFPTSYNDVDLCLRLRHAGYQVIMNPQAKLIHHESATRTIDASDENYRTLMREKWGQMLQQDRYWNPWLGTSTDWYRGLAFHWKK